MPSRARPFFSPHFIREATRLLLLRANGGASGPGMFLDYRHVALGVAAGVGVGLSAGAFLAKQQQQPAGDRRRRLQLGQRQSAAAASSSSSPHPAAKYGLPQTQTLREHDGFVAMFDASTRNPAWVIEHVTRDKMHGEADRGNSMFYEDEALDERLRNKLADFRASGYDRGHLAPAANHKGHQGAMNETFCMSNISPQVGEGFNRDYWARFEKFVKDAAKRADDLYVVTGPLFLPAPSSDDDDDDDGGGGGGGNGASSARRRTTRTTTWRANHPYIGTPPALVAVPTHFYKVVLADNGSGKHGPHRAAVGAFVMPNAAVDPQTPLEAFVVPLDALERVAGTSFFPGFVDEGRRAALDRTAAALQERGRAALPSSLDRQALADEQALLLGSPAAAAVAGSASAGSKALVPSASSAAQTPLPVPRTTGGRGAVHLCEHVACKLPQEKWWLEGKQQNGQQKKQQQRGGGGGEDGGGRASSAPPP